MKFERSGGILLHPTSLPGAYGIGELGPTAFQWVDWLASCGCKLWQILPIGPTGFGDSPYQCFSAFAGNPNLISMDHLLEEGLLTRDDFKSMPMWDPRIVDFGAVNKWKPSILRKAFDRFAQGNFNKQEYETFRIQNKIWLDDFALFMSLKSEYGEGTWLTWPSELRQRSPDILKAAAEALEIEISYHSFLQYLFHNQWEALKSYTNSKGINIIGDIPIFVAMDSSDVWANPQLFLLDKSGNPTVVAGVPPDYFSPTGQLWGNPLYRWDEHKKKGYSWWLERIRFTLKIVNIIRIDHFRGFVGYWEIPRDSTTAENGQWVPGPGSEFFDAVQAAFGDLPLIAEDLGEISQDVIALRDSYDLPGMKILQFAFSGPDNPFLPHNHSNNNVVYTGTHDNDTSCGWYSTVDETQKEFCQRYLGRKWQNEVEFNWDLIRAAWASVANLALAPMQDFLSLGSEARFNFPSKLGGNWAWRMIETDMNEVLKIEIERLNWLYQR